jgi:hypothetical protein
MNVYILWHNEWTDDGPVGVFSSRALAEAFAARYKIHGYTLGGDPAVCITTLPLDPTEPLW